ncbi:hypothetical protein P153DRAFT_144936 [Dothidotthia symphoricarpi CBS 119687]|uniref:Uncharacterized protein n=1 Tax=Dothidotthia symphoricarpi CBS 119687 TaxID=1392245 RepID=A0A6A5ZXU0_9PLEO|nr:uncharacterized protein P153DRAFT_144936 [Dothidotthia symphoricarpi CBS 119687]KAF2123723.1 hypothetical protein P153DRAFT_144936 [Dothidotthia symphoricarpi CBS 119687]
MQALSESFRLRRLAIEAWVGHLDCCGRCCVVVVHNNMSTVEAFETGHTTVFGVELAAMLKLPQATRRIYQPWVTALAAGVTPTVRVSGDAEVARDDCKKACIPLQSRGSQAYTLSSKTFQLFILRACVCSMSVLSARLRMLPVWAFVNPILQDSTAEVVIRDIDH